MSRAVFDMTKKTAGGRNCAASVLTPGYAAEPSLTAPIWVAVWVRLKAGKRKVDASGTYTPSLAEERAVVSLGQKAYGALTGDLEEARRMQAISELSGAISKRLIEKVERREAEIRERLGR